MTISRKLVYVDMDDTLCDFAGAHKEALLRNPHNKFPQAEYGFFSKLKELPRAIEGMQKLALDNDVYILTRPSIMNPLCYTEKRVWVEEYLGMDWCHKLIICPNKALLIGDLLIDDLFWSGFRGKQILFSENDYNWTHIIDHDLNGTRN